MISGAGVCCWGLTFEDIRRLYDNTPAVACTYIGSTSTSIPSASLICLLELQQQQRKSSYPTKTSIAASWLGNKVPLIKNRENKFSPSKDLSRDSENKIPVNTPVRFPPRRSRKCHSIWPTYQECPCSKQYGILQSLLSTASSEAGNA